jgi:hypothetical protein
MLWSLTGIAIVSASDWQRAAGNPGDWFTASNWSDGVPDASDGGNISNGGEAMIASGSATAYSVVLGSSAGTSGILTLRACEGIVLGNFYTFPESGCFERQVFSNHAA